MATIIRELTDILKARFGKEVRQSIYDGLNKINNEVTDTTTRQDSLERKYNEQIENIASGPYQNAEIVDARKGKSTLGNAMKLKMYCFENVATMKENAYLEVGDTVQTLGYYEENDGGAGLYKIIAAPLASVDEGSTIPLNNNFIAQLIIQEHLNIKQFGTKGDGVYDDTQAIKNAINYLTVKVLENYKKSPNILIFKGGRYKVTEQIEIPLFLRLKSEGMVYFNSYVDDTSTFFLEVKHSFAGDILNLEKQKYSRGKVFDGANGGFVINKNIKLTEGSIGLEIGSNEDKRNYPSSRFTIGDVGIFGFDIGLLLNKNNTYFGIFERLHIEINNTAVKFGKGLELAVDSGENFIFNDCIIAGAKVGVNILTTSQEITFNNCSFDFLTCILKTYGGNRTQLSNEKGFGGYSVLTLNTPHLEGVGYTDFQYIDVHDDDPKGIIYNYNDKVLYNEELIDNNCKTILKINNARFIETEVIEKLFKSEPYSNLKIDIDGFFYNSHAGNTDASKLFLADDNIDISCRNFVSAKDSTFRLLSRNLSASNFAEFEDIPNGTQISNAENAVTEIGAYKVSNVKNITSTICVTTEDRLFSDTGKVIKFQCNQAIPAGETDASKYPTLDVDDNEYYEIPAGARHIFTTLCGKNKTATGQQLFYVDYTVDFFSYNKNKMNSYNPTISTYASSINKEFGTQFAPALVEIPLNARYFKIKRHIKTKNVNGMVQYNTSYITGLYTFID